jgi:tetratricopeptide (TPR) repeat protein
LVKKPFRIFVSSPGDVQAAREIAAQTIEHLAQDYARFFDIEPYLWEFDAMLAAGHFQDSIEPPSAFDVVVLIVWSRLGTPMPERTNLRSYRGLDGRTPVTGTEWEFEEALQAAQTSGAPDLLVYRSSKPALIDAQNLDRREEQLRQLKALDGFWERHFANKGMFIGAYTSFTSDKEFADALETHLRRLIEKRIAALEARAATPWPQAPFRGLEAYEFKHAPIFFGQDEALAKAMLRLLANAEAGSPFLLVLGASGSGKSSLVKAGILPKLFVPRRVVGAAFLRRVVFRPSDAREGEDLFAALARRLTTQVSEQEGLSELIGHGQSVESLSQHLRSATAAPGFPIATALGEITDKARQSGRALEYETAKLALVVDQLEELFSMERITADERRSFVALLVGLVHSGHVWVVATMRSDFWHRAEETPELVRLSENTGRLELLPPGPAQLSQMIRRPADAAGVAFEVHKTSSVPLNEIISEEVAREPGALPLLSYLLDQLYRNDVLATNGATLTYATYERLGRLGGAIATRAEGVLQTCTAEEREALGSLLFALVDLGNAGAEVERAVARRIPLSTFPPGTPRRRLVEALLDPEARLLVSDAEHDTSPTIRIAHEALITRWERAREYVERNAEALKIRRRIEERYALWHKLTAADSSAPPDATATSAPTRLKIEPWRPRFGREKGLLTDIDLADGQRLLKEHRADTEPHLIAYIERSNAQDKRLRARTVRVLSLIAIVIALLAVIAMWQRDIAKTEGEIANRIRDFMIDMFENADPERSAGETLTVKKMLDDGAETIRSEKGLRLDPRVRAELQTAMGQAYTGLGLYKPALDELTEAKTEEQNTSVPAESQVRTLVAYGTAQFLADDNAGAEDTLWDAVRLARHKLPTAAVLRSQALTALADVFVAQGKFAKAEQLCNEALAADRQRSSDPEDTAVLANTLDSLGSAYYFSNDLHAAEAPWIEALDKYNRVQSPRRAKAMSNLGTLYYQLGRYQQALDTYQLALPVFYAVYGDEHPQVAGILNNLGRSLLIAGRIDDAEPLLRQSLAMTIKLEGNHHYDVVPPLNSVGMIEAYRGNLENARKDFEEAELIACMPNQAELLDQVLLNEADLALTSSQPDHAAALLNQSKALLMQAYPDVHANAWRYAVWDTVNAELLASKGDLGSATASIDAARATILQRFGEAGFYSLLAARRASIVANTQQR